MKRLALSACSIVTLLLCVQGAHASSPKSISVSADKNEATLEDQIILTVTIEGDRQAFPSVPSIPAFDVVRRGGASTQVQFGSGGYRSSVEYTFLLSPKRIGTFTVPSFTVEQEGKTYKSQPFKIKIISPKATPSAKRNLFITGSVSTDTPFVQQQLVYTWRFFKSNDVQIDGRSPRVEFPDFEGFVAIQLDEQREYTMVKDGTRFSITEMRFILFPQEEGLHTIGRSSLNLDVIKPQPSRQRDIFGDIFQRGQRVSKRIISEPVKLTIKPLPPAPDNFTGLVGEFSASSSLSTQNLASGESATLTYKISGKGNLDAIKPPFPEALEGFKIYHDKATNQPMSYADSLGGFKEFRAALVPLAPGNYTIPPIEVAFFNPDTEAYETAASPEYIINVRPGSANEKLNLTGSSDAAVAKQAVKTLGDDLLPLDENVDGVSVGLGLLDNLPGRALCFFAPPLLFALLFGFRRRSELEQSDVSLRRKRLALTHALRNLKGLKGNDSERITGSATIIRQFIGDKLNLEGKALTPTEATDQLRRAQVADSTIEKVSELLRLSEAAQYGMPTGASHGGSPLPQVHKLLSHLDKELSS